MTDTKTRNVHIEALARSLGTPSVDGLIYSLRHPETWPNGFSWDFEYCSSCAMGLSRALWPDGQPWKGQRAAVSLNAARSLASAIHRCRERIFLRDAFAKRFLFYCGRFAWITIRSPPGDGRGRAGKICGKTEGVMGDFLMTRTWKQWAVLAAWLVMVAMIGALNLMQGHPWQAMSLTTVYIGIFVAAAYGGYRNSRKV